MQVLMIWTAQAMADLPIKFDVKMTPQQTADILRAKGLIPPTSGYNWQDIERDEHAAGFTVAKATSYDVLNAIKAAMYKAQAEGMTPQQFIRELKPILIEQGWWGRQLLTDPKTGVTKVVQLGSPHRLRTIFDTNLRTSRAVGKWQRIQERKESAPYLRYRAVLDNRTRPQHEKWGSLPVILPVDHPWWNLHFPPNGWFCRCNVDQITDVFLRSRGLKVTQDPPTGTKTYTNSRTGEVREVPLGIDPGFDYNPGSAGRTALQLRPLETGKQEFKKASAAKPAASEYGPIKGGQEVAADLLYPDLPTQTGRPAGRDADAAQIAEKQLDDLAANRTFVNVFSPTGKPTLFTDVTGEPLMIGDAFFKTLDGSYKFTDKNRRRSHVLLLAESLRRPDEIWELTEVEETTGAVRTVRRYLARFTISGSGEPFDGFVVVQFDPVKRRWVGTTAFGPELGPESDYLEGQRQGRRVYVRTP
jgi:SPP1 gp7 family putative phage head morphogenesis protein